jgi:hypothetical protein
VPGGQQVQAALGAVVNRGGPRRRLVERLLGLCLRAGQGGLGFLVRLGGSALGLGPGGGHGLLGLGPRGGDGPLGLLLGRGEHALGLLARLGPGLVGLGLGIVALPGYFFVGLGLLRPGLVVGQLEDLGDPLTDFLVRGLGPQRLLAGGGQVVPELLALVQGAGQALLQVADLAPAAGNKFINLAAAVSTHLHFECVFVNEVRQEITVVIHGFPKSCCPK